MGSPSTAIALPHPPAAARFPLWSTLVEAFDVTLSQPDLWLIGAAGFLLRGGFVVLLLTLVQLPSPVEVRLLLGDGLGSAGFSGTLVAVTALIGLVTAALLLGAMWTLAALEVWAFERTVTARGLGRLAGADRRRALSWIFVVQAGASVLIGAATLPLIAQATSVAYQEIVRPSGDGPLYLRIFSGIEPQLVLVGLAIVVAEALSAVATRQVLGRAVGAPASAQRRWRPLVALCGWTVSAGVLLPTLWALSVVWHSVSAALLGVAGSSLGSLTVGVAIGALACVWGAAFVLAGFASALRGALWTMQELR